MKLVQLVPLILLSMVAFGQQPCPSGYHHEGDSAACWPDVSREGSSTVTLNTQPKADSQPASQAQELQPPTQGAQSRGASLVIFREGHFTGSALKPSIYLDGREVARVKNGTYFTMQLEPGQHTLNSSAKHQPPLAIEVKPGETSYVQMIVVAGTWRGAGRLIPVPPDDGRSAVAKLHILN